MSAAYRIVNLRLLAGAVLEKRTLQHRAARGRPARRFGLPLLCPHCGQEVKLTPAVLERLEAKAWRGTGLRVEHTTIGHWWGKDRGAEVVYHQLRWYRCKVSGNPRYSTLSLPGDRVRHTGGAEGENVGASFP